MKNTRNVLSSRTGIKTLILSFTEIPLAIRAISRRWSVLVGAGQRRDFDEKPFTSLTVSNLAFS